MNSEDVHTFGKEFEKKDVFVSWSCKKKEAGGRGKQQQQCNDKQNETYLRFYHVFENNELESLFASLDDTKIVESFYEQGNWCVIFEKKS